MDAKALLDGADADDKEGPLTDFLRAELLTATNSPRAEVSDIMPILARSPHLPQAEQLARLATRRGATDLPALPVQARLTWAGSAPRRLNADTVNSDPVAAGLARTIPDRIKNDDPAGAEALLNAVIDRLTPEARDEWRQRRPWRRLISRISSSRRMTWTSATSATPIRLRRARNCFVSAYGPAVRASICLSVCP